MSPLLKSKNLLLSALILTAIAGGIFGLKIKTTQAVTIGAPLGTDQTKKIEEQQAAGAQKAVEKAKIEENQAKINYDAAVKQYGADSTDPEFLKIKTAYEGTQSEVQKTEEAKTAVPETAKQTASQKPPDDSSGFRFPIVFHIIGGILWAISWLLTKLIGVAASLAETILNIKDFAKVDVVKSGWEITRGLANMFFALILLIMAFATTLRLESFGYKKILPRLVLSALLINFSLVFAGMIIDFSNVFTTYFIDAITKNGGISAQLMSGLGITRIFDFSQADKSWWDSLMTALGGPSSTMLMELTVSIILLLIVAFSFFALALFLIFRVVVIWLLLIFAPLAWVSMIVPGKAGSLWGQWWGIFLKWVFFAPIYSFFLFLGLLMASQNTINNMVVPGKETTKLFFGSSFFSNPGILLQYIAVVIILLGGLIAAQKMGIYGASGVMKLGSKMVKGTTGFAAGKFDQFLARGKKDQRDTTWGKMRRGMSYLSPTGWKMGWKARQDQKAKEAYGRAAGARQDLLNRIFSLGNEKTDYEQRAIRAREAEEEKNITTENAEEKIAGFVRAFKYNDPEKMAAFLKSLTKVNDQNEILRYLCKIENWTKLGLDKQTGRDQADYTMDAKGWTTFIEEIIKPKFGAGQAYRLGHDSVRLMEGNGQWIGRPFTVDPETGEYHILGPDGRPTNKAYSEFSDADKDEAAKQARYGAHIEWSKGDPQEQVRRTGRFTFIIEAYNPQTGGTIDRGMTEEGLSKLAVYLPDHANRMHEHTRNLLLTNHAQEFENANAGAFIRVLKSLQEKVEGMDEQAKNNYIERMLMNVPTLASEAGLSEADQKQARTTRLRTILDRAVKLPKK